MDSPKRKRNKPQAPTPPDSSPMRLDTSITLSAITSDDTIQGSPQTRVAHHFGNLALDGPEIKKLDFTNHGGEQILMNEEPTARKRVKIFGEKDSNANMDSQEMKEIPETPHKETSEGLLYRAEEKKPDANIGEMGKEVKLHNEVDPMVFRAGLCGPKKKAGGLARAYPSINRLADSKSRGRKIMGTPPLSGSGSGDVMEEERVIVDPDRAALTWHDDEITGHDPNDPDDDGEGINGVGFRPTAAIAYARAERRKQQMADYRSREAREARARRSERRRGDELAKAAARAEADTAARRVRFLETEKPTIISTL